jgi:hypothetical protein
MKTLYSEFCDFAYVNNNIILRWKDKLIKYVKNINFDFISSQENYENFNIQSNSTIFVSMSIQIFNISINELKFILSFNTNAKTILVHVTRYLFLNKKQHLICEKILIHFLNYKINSDDNSSS